MYSPALAKKWLYDLFPLRHLTRKFRVPTFQSEAPVLLTDPVSSMPVSAAPDPAIHEIYEERAMVGMGYFTLPEQEAFPRESFEALPFMPTERFLDSHNSRQSPLMEPLDAPESPAAMEINAAINQASGVIPEPPSPGMEPGLEGSLDNPLEQQPPMEMGLEQRLNDPFMNPLFDPLFNPFNPLGPGF